MKALLEKYPELAHGTVGAAAIDANGQLVAGTSTGGVTMKLAGRIGDTSLPGAGTYATTYGAASATGRGELMMRTLTTRAVCDRIEGGRNAQDASEDVIVMMAETVGESAGVIAVDPKGNIGVAHGSESMPHAWQIQDEEAHVAMRRAL